MEHTFSTGKTIKAQGTAIFISPRHIITAGHVFVPPSDDGSTSNTTGTSKASSTFKTWITYPGCERVDLDNANKLECRLLKNLYDGPPAENCDIALLDVPCHVAKNYLPPVLNYQPRKEESIHILGYPGEVRRDFIEKNHPGVDNVNIAREQCKTMLPRHQLTVTGGFVSSVQPNGLISTKVSTIVGMSGSIVISNNKAIGMSYTQDKLMTLGIHLGQYQNFNENKALLFSHPDVQGLFQKYLGRNDPGNLTCHIF